MIPGTGRALGPLLLLLALLQCAARRWAAVKRSVPDVCATCHIHATCHQIEGKSVCICNYGFVGNGRTHCQDIDECEESGLCGHNAKCVNTEGSYKCYCNDGYKLENGERSFHPDGNTVSCREIGCGSPPEMKHGYVVGNYSLLPGSAVHYECKEGFYSNEGKSSYCTANETWEPATLSCKGVDCGDPPSVLNAHPASVSGTTYGSEVTYNCVHGYFMASGNQTAVCNAEGQWDGTDLVCKEIDCGKPLLIPHTEMTWDNSTTLRSRVYYRCKEGYYFNGGRNFSECTIDQSWENITFICKEEELFSNLSIFNETCVKWERKTGRLGVQKTYTFRILGQRWDEKTFSEDVIFNITTNEDNPKVCLDLDSGSNYVVNITTISSTNIPVSVTVAVQTKVKEPFNNVLIFNDTCLKWQRNVRGTDVQDRYSFHVQGQRWYQKEFFHEMIFDLTTHKQAPEVCFDLQPGTNYSVNISMAALNFSLLVSLTTQITDPPFPDVEFVAVTGSAPLLRLRKAEDQNGPISFYQVIVLPLDLQSTFICDSFAAATFFSNATDVKGYVAAEFQAKDVADNMPISLGDRHYYGKFYNAPLKLGEEYCVFLRVISEWNKVRTQSCAIWAQIKNLAPMPQYMTAVGLGSVAAVCLILFLTFSAARSYLHNTVSSPPAALACEAVYLSATMDTAQLGITSSFLETENVSLL
ncbi:sushi domain-containing protein 1 isoform 3-T3 [Guaruba guarouba]